MADAGLPAGLGGRLRVGHGAGPRRSARLHHHPAQHDPVPRHRLLQDEAAQPAGPRQPVGDLPAGGVLGPAAEPPL